MSGPTRDPAASPSGRRSPWRWLAGASLAELFSMALFLNFTAVLPTLQADWRLSNAQSGVIVSCYQLGYLLASVVLTRLTDYYGIRWIYVASSAWAGASGIAFALLAHDFWSAAVLRLFAGVGLAGTYMPGMRAVAERFAARGRGTAMAIYVGVFGIGTAFSLWLTNALSAYVPVRAALALPALAPLVAGVMALGLFAGGAPARAAQARFFEPRVLRNPAALAMIAGYAMHTWELYAMRAWLPPFLIVCLLNTGAPLAAASRDAAVISSLLFVLGALSTAAGGWLADRAGRTAVIAGSLAISGGCSLGIGWLNRAPMGMVVAVAVVYSVFITSDSGALSAAVADLAHPQLLGATMALQTLVGFSAATVSPMVFGVMMDATNVSRQITATAYPTNWNWAFAGAGIAALLGTAVVLVAAPARSCATALPSKT